LASCCGRPTRRNSVLEEFSVKRLQPEDGDEQIDKHDGCRQNVDIKQCDRDQGAFWAARQSSAVQVESTVVAAVSNVASQRTNISQ